MSFDVRNLDASVRKSRSYAIACCFFSSSASWITSAGDMYTASDRVLALVHWLILDDSDLVEWFPDLPAAVVDEAFPNRKYWKVVSVSLNKKSRRNRDRIVDMLNVLPVNGALLPLLSANVGPQLQTRWVVLAKHDFT